MKSLSKDMVGVVKGMDVALKSMDAEKIGLTMDKFEEKMETMDVVSGMMEGTMAGATATLTPTESVDDLIMQVADENALEINWQMDAAPTGAVAAPPAAEAEQEPANALEKRLAQLRAA
jgi:charged multivesicular body protein 1